MFEGRTYRTLLFILIIAVSTGCLKSKKPGIPEPVRKIISLSGINNDEFLAAIVHYKKPADSLKLKALYYLISNMGSHYEITYKIQDSTGKTYTFPLQNYPDYPTLIRHLRLLEESRGKLKVEHDTIILDIYSRKSSLLTTTVDTAFESWQNPSYKGAHYSFKDFCNYILPYRVANEKAEPFRHFLRGRYHDKIFHLLKKDSTDIISLISKIHIVVTNEIRFDRRMEMHFNYPSIDEISEDRVGNYRDIAIYEVKTFRSFGIPSTMDYCPYFADTSGGYFWPVVKIDSGRFIPIYYPNVSAENLLAFGKVPKIFRRIYTDDSSSLFRIKEVTEHTPAFIGQFNYKDVTDEYIPTANVPVTFSDTAKFSYLSVFNNGSWHPVHWSLSKNKRHVLFTKMGLNIIYLPTIVQKDTIKAAGFPFLLTSNGKVKILSGKTTPPVNVVLSKTNPHNRLEAETIYSLYKWENGDWDFVKLIKSNFKNRLIAQLYPYELYILRKQGNTNLLNNERPFILIDKHIRFY